MLLTPPQAPVHHLLHLLVHSIDSRIATDSTARARLVIAWNGNILSCRRAVLWLPFCALAHCRYLARDRSHSCVSAFEALEIFVPDDRHAYKLFCCLVVWFAAFGSGRLTKRI